MQLIERKVIDLGHHIILNSRNAEALEGSIGNIDALISVDGDSACHAGEYWPNQLYRDTLGRILKRRRT